MFFLKLFFSHIDLDPHKLDFIFGNEVHGENHTHPHTHHLLSATDLMVEKCLFMFLASLLGTSTLKVSKVRQSR
jgi:hypothetical protein